MPFADVRGLVTQALQFEVVIGQAVAGQVAGNVVDDAVAAGVLAGQY